MTDIGIIADSASSLSDEFIEENDIGIARFKYTLGGVTYSEGLEESAEEYHLRLRDSDDYPKTSQPALGDYISLYEEYSVKYGQVLVFPLSRGLSGSYQTAVLAAEDYDNVTVIDTCNALDGNRLLIERAVEMAKEDYPAQDIIEKINHDKAYPNIRASLIVNRLSYLEKGGRLPASLAKAGDFLKIKPIININEKGDGKLGVTEISRGDKRTIKRIIELIPKETKRIAIGDVNEREIRKELEAQIREKFPQADLSYATVTPVIASHLGPSCYGLFYSLV